MKIDGRFWLTKDNESFLGLGRVALLKEIEKTGSINAAAKNMKMSYKAAWERINSMNELADEPLMTRTTGGKGGGGTTLTPYARELIKTYERLDELHREFMKRFATAGDDPEHLARILARTFLTTSARNQLPCKIEEINTDALNANIRLALHGGVSLISGITAKSAKNMGLEAGSDVYAIIKSSDIDITAELPPDKDNKNTLQGIVTYMDISEDTCEISLRVNEHLSLTAVTDNKNTASLKKGDRAYALIKKSNIVIGL